MKRPPAAPVEAVAQDHRCWLGGHVDDITILGCEFTSAAQAPIAEFAPGARIQLHLLDVDRQLGECAWARVGSVRLHGGTCTYRLEWDDVPRLLLPFQRSVEESIQARRASQARGA